MTPSCYFGKMTSPGTPSTAHRVSALTRSAINPRSTCLLRTTAIELSRTIRSVPSIMARLDSASGATRKIGRLAQDPDDPSHLLLGETDVVQATTRRPTIGPDALRRSSVVERMGLEPTTPCLQSRRLQKSPDLGFCSQIGLRIGRVIPWLGVLSGPEPAWGSLLRWSRAASGSCCRATAWRPRKGARRRQLGRDSQGPHSAVDASRVCHIDNNETRVETKPHLAPTASTPPPDVRGGACGLRCSDGNKTLQPRT